MFILGPQLVYRNTIRCIRVSKKKTDNHTFLICKQTVKVLCKSSKIFLFSREKARQRCGLHKLIIPFVYVKRVQWSAGLSNFIKIYRVVCQMHSEIMRLSDCPHNKYGNASKVVCISRTTVGITYMYKDGGFNL